jgi:uncharacterized membrane protein HdeD (DUF308 family)
MTSSRSEAAALQDVRTFGLVLIAGGVLSAVAGILALVYPDVTLLALALIAGINLLLLGALSLVEAFASGRDATGRILSVVLGILGMIAGLVVIRRPGETLLALLLVLGIWLVVTGIADFVRAFTTLEGRALRLLGALVDVVLGVLVLALPELSLGTLALLIGLSFVVRGVIGIARGVAVRRAAGALAAETPLDALPA